MHTYAKDRLNLHIRHIQDIDIHGVLARQQDVTSQHHRGDLDDEAFARAEAEMQLQKGEEKTNAHLHQLQVYYTEEEDGTRNYVVSDLDDDKSKYGNIVYVKKNCDENEQVMYR